MMTGFKKGLLIAAGFLSLGLGTIGIVLPVLPTTPFLLLAAYCFLRSSKRLHHWLLHHPLFGRYIYHYLQYRAVKKSAKITAIALLWPSLLFSMYLVGKPWVAVMLVIIGSAVTWHILSLKTYRENG